MSTNLEWYTRDEDPDEIEWFYHESFEEVTAGAKPVLTGDAIVEVMGSVSRGSPHQSSPNPYSDWD